MSKRKWAVGSFVPCSPRHHHCSPAHAALVRGYREERERQQTANEEYLCNGPGEREHWKAKGGTMITFHTWLKANKKGEKWQFGQSIQSMPLQDKDVDGSYSIGPSKWESKRKRDRSIHAKAL